MLVMRPIVVLYIKLISILKLYCVFKAKIALGFCNCWIDWKILTISPKKNSPNLELFHKFSNQNIWLEQSFWIYLIKMLYKNDLCCSFMIYSIVFWSKNNEKKWFLTKHFKLKWLLLEKFFDLCQITQIKILLVRWQVLEILL